MRTATVRGERRAWLRRLRATAAAPRARHRADISAYFEPRRDQYYAALLGVSTNGDWAGWLRFFLTAVAEQAHNAMRRARSIQRLRDDYRRRLATARSSSLLLKLADHLFETPAITVPGAQLLLGITYRAASQNVGKLAAAGILHEVQSAGRARVFLATEILDVIEGRVAALARRS